MKKVKEIKEDKPESVIEFILKISLADIEIPPLRFIDNNIYEQGFRDCKDYIIDQLKKKGF